MIETLRSADVIHTETDALKVPPHSLQAEQAVLGGLMLLVCSVVLCPHATHEPVCEVPESPETHDHASHDAEHDLNAFAYDELVLTAYASERNSQADLLFHKVASYSSNSSALSSSSIAALRVVRSSDA